jgi:FkbM family methyltransferase
VAVFAEEQIVGEIPEKHVAHLRDLKAGGFEPTVIYDIGACRLHWAVEATAIWPDARIILFDAMDFSQLWEGFEYHIGPLSDSDDREVRFYYHPDCPGGNSYYKEFNDGMFPPDRFTIMRTNRLDTVVARNGWPLPDLVKIDTQGSEKDIIAGGLGAILHATRLIVEMQAVHYNIGAPLVGETLPWIENLGFRCISPLFCNNGPDGDYDFVRVDGQNGST